MAFATGCSCLKATRRRTNPCLALQEERVGLLTTWLNAIVSMDELRKHPQLWVFLGLDASVGVSEAAALQVHCCLE